MIRKIIQKLQGDSTRSSTLPRHRNGFYGFIVIAVTVAAILTVV